MNTVTRRLAGPFATRVCTPATGGGFSWHEERAGGLTGLLDAAELDALREVVPREPCAPVVPRLLDDVAVWTGVPTSRLAFDIVFGGTVFGGADIPDGAAAAFRRLGGYLGRLHRTAIPAALAGLCTARERVQPVDPRVRAAREEARGWLADRAGMPAERPDPAPWPDPVLTHGRFSLGVLVWAPVPVVLGWREAGPGPAKSDVDGLLAELAEAAALAPQRAAQLAGLGSVFWNAYAEVGAAGAVPAAGLAERLAVHVLDHMALRAAVAGDREAPLSLLRRVLSGLAWFCGLIEAGAPAPAEVDGG